MESHRTTWISFFVFLQVFFWTASGQAQSSADEVKEIVRQNDVTTIEELLPHLSDDLRGRFVLMYDSRSLQEASPRKPRVIMFNQDASFILAFNGTEDGHGYGQLEMSEFDPQTTRFHFSFIEFPEDRGERGEAVFSKKDPALCKSCHESDLRPNWEAYPVWPGAYGSVHIGENKTFDEREALEDFIDHETQFGRYKHLVEVDTRYPESDLAGPNRSFTKSLARLNFKRVRRLLRSTPDYERYKYGLLGAINNCKIETFYPDRIHARMDQPLAHYITDSQRIEKRISERQKEFGASGNTFYRHEHVGKLRYLVEGRGISMDGWAMPFGPRPYNFSTGNSGIEDLTRFLAADVENMTRADCDELKRLSLEAFSGS